MFQGGWRTARTCDVRQPPILHRTRLVHGRRGLVPLVPSTRRLPLQLHAGFGMAAGMEGAGWMARAGPDRRVIEGHCSRAVLLARAVFCDLMVTSVYVQVPEDTIFCDVLIWEHRLRQKFYWTMRGGIEAIWSFVISRIHHCSVIAARQTFFLAI